MTYQVDARYRDKDGKVVEINRTGAGTDGVSWTSYFFVKNGKRSGPSRQSKTETLVKRFREIA